MTPTTTPFEKEEKITCTWMDIKKGENGATVIGNFQRVHHQTNPLILQININIHETEAKFFLCGGRINMKNQKRMTINA